jgi:nuclear autoantigenic sperm protein
LLYKYQEESDPLGDVPKSAPKEESVKSTTGKNDSESSKASCTNNVEDAASSEKVDAEEVQNLNGKDQDDGNEEIDKDDVDGDDEKAGDEDDSDLDLSWKMLDIARVIVEKSPDSTLQKVKIFSVLGEVSLEREDVDTSLSDYFKALTILEQMAEPDHRRIVELNFRICLVYELACKTEDAIPYCAKAISLCKSRIERLKNSKDVLLAGKDDNASAAEGVLEKAQEDEIESLTGILGDLEKKLEDLEQAMSTPRSALDDIIKTVAMRAAHEQKDDVNAIPRAASFTSSQMATTSNGFDSSTISTTGSTGSTVTDLGVVGRGVKRASIEPTGSTGSTVNDLGVVGRGVKRASMKPISAEPSSKKPALDSPSPQVGSSNKSEVATAQNGDDAVSK